MPLLLRFQISTVTLLISIILQCIAQSPTENGDPSLLKIPQGLVQGKVLKSREGKIFYGFMGIPFAQPPERFEPAKIPAPLWEGIYDATEYKPKCLQLNFTTSEAEGSENCLFINVFSPQPTTTGKLSVIAFVHGGGFQFGLAYENGPEFILDHDVVFVTFTYRLASLGFLSTYDTVVPGNNGLKDQNLALRWIQDNVLYFGGDPTKVTLFGESAGAASVSSHIVSPLSQGLFRHAICQSGSSLDRWPFVENPKQNAIKLAEKLDCPTSSSQEILECLKKKPGKDIVKVQLRTSLIDSMIMFGPVLEASGDGAFLTESPQLLYKEGRFSKVPLIITINDVEGLLLNALLILGSPELIETFNQNWDEAVATAFCFDKDYYSTEAKKWATRKLREYYFGSKLIGPDTLQNLTNMYTDGTFAQRAWKTALTHGKYAPTFISMLGFRGIWSQAFLMGFQQIVGMTHADDLSYLFTDFKYPPFPSGSPSEGFSKLLVKLWVNFANTGDPGFKMNDHKWTPLSSEEISKEEIEWLYLKNQPEFLVEPLRERIQIWNEIDTVLETGIIPPSKDEL